MKHCILLFLHIYCYVLLVNIRPNINKKEMDPTKETVNYSL